MPPPLRGIAFQSNRAKRILVEPRSGRIPLARGLSPRWGSNSKMALPRADARGYRSIAAPRLNKDAAFAAITLEVEDYSGSPDSPAIYWTAVKEFFRHHDTILFKDDAVLHDEIHLSERINIFERIAAHRDHVCEIAFLDRSPLFINFADLEPIRRHDLENLLRGNSRGFPA